MNIDLGGGIGLGNDRRNRRQRRRSSRKKEKNDSDPWWKDEGEKLLGSAERSLKGMAKKNPAKLFEAGDQFKNLRGVNSVAKSATKTFDTMVAGYKYGYEPQPFNRGTPRVALKGGDEFVDDLGKFSRETYGGLKTAARKWQRNRIGGDKNIRKGLKRRFGRNRIGDFLGNAKRGILSAADDSKAMNYLARYSDEAAGGADLLGKLGSKATPSLFDAAFYGYDLWKIDQKRDSGKITSREAKIKFAKTTGGVIGGIIGGAAGSLAGGPLGALAGGAAGDYLGRKAGGWVAKQMVGSPNKKPNSDSTSASFNTTSTSQETRERLKVHIPDSNAPASSSPDRRTQSRDNRAKANKRARSEPAIINQEVRMDPSSIQDIDRRIEEAKQEAVREMERRFGPRPTQF